MYWWLSRCTISFFLLRHWDFRVRTVRFCLIFDASYVYLFHREHDSMRPVTSITIPISKHIQVPYVLTTRNKIRYPLIHLNISCDLSPSWPPCYMYRVPPEGAAAVDAQNDHMKCFGEQPFGQTECHLKRLQAVSSWDCAEYLVYFKRSVVLIIGNESSSLRLSSMLVYLPSQVALDPAPGSMRNAGCGSQLPINELVEDVRTGSPGTKSTRRSLGGK